MKLLGRPCHTTTTPPESPGLLAERRRFEESYTKPVIGKFPQKTNRTPPRPASQTIRLVIPSKKPREMKSIDLSAKVQKHKDPISCSQQELGLALRVCFNKGARHLYWTFGSIKPAFCTARDPSISTQAKEDLLTRILPNSDIWLTGCFSNDYCVCSGLSSLSLMDTQLTDLRTVALPSQVWRAACRELQCSQSSHGCRVLGALRDVKIEKVLLVSDISQPRDLNCARPIFEAHIRKLLPYAKRVEYWDPDDNKSRAWPLWWEDYT